MFVNILVREKDPPCFAGPLIIFVFTVQLRRVIFRDRYSPLV